MTAFETLPGAAIAIIVKRVLPEPVMIVAAVCSDCSIEVMARSEVWSMEPMTLQVTFVGRVFVGAIVTVTVVVIPVDVRKSKP
jgi:hypothetical protein